MIIYNLKKTLAENYQNFERYLSLKMAFFLVVLAISLATLGFVLIEDYSFVEAFYMSIITISTVGYTEVQPLSSNGQLFASVMIMINIGIYAYSISAFTQYVIHGELFKALHMDAMEKDIAQLRNHVIICGYGRYGKEITSQLIKNEVDFIVIDNEEEKIDHLRHDNVKILYIHDDATHDEVLERAGIAKAKALISALPEDAENVFTVLSARQLNATVTIVSRAIDPRTEKKLKMAGADYVILPEQIGGFHMANLVLNPSAVDFFSSLIKASEKSIQLEEIPYAQLKPQHRGKSLIDLDIRQQSGANVIGIRSNSGYDINPSPTKLLQKGESYIILGNQQQIQSFLLTYTLPFNP